MHMQLASSSSTHPTFGRWKFHTEPIRLGSLAHFMDHSKSKKTLIKDKGIYKLVISMHAVAIGRLTYVISSCQLAMHISCVRGMSQLFIYNPYPMLLMGLL